MAPERRAPALLLLAATALAPSCVPSLHPVFQVVLQLVAVVLLALTVCGPWRPDIGIRAPMILFGLMAISIDAVGMLLIGALTPANDVALIVDVATMICTAVALLAASLSGSINSINPWPFAAAAAVGGSVLIALSHPQIDVLVFLHDSAHSLLHGHDPYALTFRSPFSAWGNHEFYGPGLVRHGIIQVGFPYPPPVLLAATGGALLGNVRFAGAIAMAIAAWAVRRSRIRHGGILLLLAPAAAWIAAASWVEPVSVALLALTVVAWRRESWTAPFWLGALLVSKQYFIVIVPLLVLLVPIARRSLGVRRAVIATIATAAVLVVPFLAWNPGAFWLSVVRFQFLQPFRADSWSLFVVMVDHLGWPPVSASSWLPLVASVGTAVVVAWRAPRHPAAFSAGVALVLLVLITLSKQAFANYFFLAVCAVLIAALTWPAEDDPARRPDSVGPRSYGQTHEHEPAEVGHTGHLGAAGASAVRPDLLRGGPRDHRRLGRGRIDDH